MVFFAGMPAHPTIGVVLLNWNGMELLKRFLPSVIRHSSGEGVRIYLADNASTDGSADYAEAEYPGKIEVIRNAGNYGYARGYNEALRDLPEKYFVLLNTDVEVSEGWIDPIITRMESDGSIAACQPKLLSYAARDTFEYAGAAGGMIDRLGYPFCRGRMFDSFERDEGQYDRTDEVFWASGAAMFIRADIFRQAGGFEEEFFAHMEEIDLCWRIRRMGYRILTCPASTVYHLGGGTLQKMSPRKTYLNFRNNRLMITKNIPRRYFVWNLLVRDVLDLAAGFQALCYGKFSESGAIFRALIDFHLALPKWIRKRLRLNDAICAANPEGPADLPIYRRSIVFLYFIRGIKKYSELP